MNEMKLINKSLEITPAKHCCSDALTKASVWPMDREIKVGIICYSIK